MTEPTLTALERVVAAFDFAGIRYLRRENKYTVILFIVSPAVADDPLSADFSEDELSRRHRFFEFDVNDGSMASY